MKAISVKDGKVIKKSGLVKIPSSHNIPPHPGRQLHSHGLLHEPFTHPGYG